jgi:hypothetical protein
MSHFAEINSKGIVIRKIVAEQDFINSGAVGDSFNWVQYSYNNNFRHHAPAYGDQWDSTNNVFISPQPYPSWALDASFDWQPPTAMPDDGKMYNWNEENTQWVEKPE